MNRDEQLIDSIIREAEQTASSHLDYFKAKIDRDIQDTWKSRDQFISDMIEAEDMPLRMNTQFYDVRNPELLKSQVSFQYYNDWPVIGSGSLKLLSKEKKEQLVSVLWPYFQRIQRIDYLKGLIKPQENIIQDQVIDEILKSMFNLAPYELPTLKSNLVGEDQYITLQYIGTKVSLWKHLGKLRNAGIERKEIVRVFAEKMTYKKTHASTPVKLKHSEIDKKIGKRG